MKRMILVLLIAFTGISALRAASYQPVKKIADGALTTLSKEMEYPCAAREAGLEGFVIVSLQVNEDGHATITEANGSHPCLISYVSEKISSMNFAGSEGQSFAVKYVFKLL